MSATSTRSPAPTTQNAGHTRPPSGNGRPARRVKTGQRLSLEEAVSSLVHPGDTVALEGFTHLIPFAAGHEIIRQGHTDLHLVRLTPDLLFDQMIGAGCVSELTFSWGGNPGVGSLHRFRDAVEHQWPQPLALHEHSHAGLTHRLVAAAAGLPFNVMRGYQGTDLVDVADHVATVECPFTGEPLTAVSALHPDVTIVHAQQVDRDGHVGIWGIQGVQKEAVLAAGRVVVTVEEEVERLDPRTTCVLPAWTLDAVSVAPGGAHPSYAAGYGTRDNDYYVAWDAVSRDRDLFRDWISANVLGSGLDRLNRAGQSRRGDPGRPTPSVTGERGYTE